MTKPKLFHAGKPSFQDLARLLDRTRFACRWRSASDCWAGSGPNAVIDVPQALRVM